MDASALMMLVVGCVIGAAFVAWFLRRQQGLTVEAALASAGADAQAKLATLGERLAARDDDVGELQARLAKSQADAQSAANALADERVVRAGIEVALRDERERTAEKLALVAAARDELSAQFRAVAGEALEVNRVRMNEQHRGALDQILKPLGDKIVAFEKKVEETYDKEAQQRSSLRQEVLNLQAATLQINEDARNLTLALKGEAKTRGNWGEVVLERVLERSGLVKGVEYRSQQTLRGEEGDVSRPDVVILMPDDKHLVIDSKVSLVAYDGYHSSPDDPTRATHGKRHVDAMRKHVRTLSDKNYQGGKDFDSPDFVAMFVPIEPAFSLATSLDPDLFLDAWELKVVIVTPSTLLALLMTVHTLWQRDKQTRNAIEIADESGKLYDQFVMVIQALQDLGKQLKDAQRAFDMTERRLVEGPGNLVGRVQKLKEMGAKTKRLLPADLLSRASVADDAASDAAVEAANIASKLTLVPDVKRDGDAGRAGD